MDKNKCPILKFLEILFQRENWKIDLQHNALKRVFN